MPETTPESPPQAADTRHGPLLVIAGMSRGGTTWTGKCLNEHSQAAVFGESLFWGRRYLPPKSDGRYSREETAMVLESLRNGFKHFVGDGPGHLKKVTSQHGGEIIEAVARQLPPRPTPYEVFATYGREIARREGKATFVEKTPHSVLWIDRIIAQAPDLRMLVLVRNPYDFMLSYKHQGDRKPAEVRQAFQEVYHPFGCAMVWRGYARAALKARDVYPRQTLLISFEELTAPESGAIQCLQEFFGLPIEPIERLVPTDNTSFPGGARPELSAVDLFWMNLIARKWIRTLGYERQRTPFAPLGVLWSLVTLVPWAWRSYRYVASTRRDSTLKYLLNWVRPRIGRNHG